MGYGKSSSKRKVYRDTSQTQETRKFSNKYPTLTPKRCRKGMNKTHPKLVKGKKL